MTVHLHDPEAPPRPVGRMTAAFNIIGQARDALREMPEPDAADLAHLAAMARRDPDRAFVPGPCLVRLEYAGFIESKDDPRLGRRVVVTEAGRAAIAELPA